MEVAVAELTDEERAVVEQHYPAGSLLRDLVRTSPPSITLPRHIATNINLLRAITVRLDTSIDHC